MGSCINQSQRRYSLVHVNRTQNIVNRATLIANGYHVFNFRLYGIVGSATFLMNTNGQWRVVLSELGREMTSKVTVLFQSWHATIVWAVIGEQSASMRWFQVGPPDITTPDKGPMDTPQSKKEVGGQFGEATGMAIYVPQLSIERSMHWLLRFHVSM